MDRFKKCARGTKLDSLMQIVHFLFDFFFFWSGKNIVYLLVHLVASDSSIVCENVWICDGEKMSWFALVFFFCICDSRAMVINGLFSRSSFLIGFLQLLSKHLKYMSSYWILLLAIYIYDEVYFLFVLYLNFDRVRTYEKIIKWWENIQIKIQMIKSIERGDGVPVLQWIYQSFRNCTHISVVCVSNPCMYRF